MTDINARIKSEIDSADIVLFLKGTPQAPQCGFSMQVVQILEHVGAPYKAINVLADNEIREGIKGFSNWPRFWTRKASRASRPPRRKIARIFARPRAPGSASRAPRCILCAPKRAS